MEWQLALLLLLGSLLVLMASGMPVAFCFMVMNAVGVILFWGGEAGLRHLIISFFSSVTSFTLLPIPLFTLMGEVMFHSRVAPNMIDALDKWIGRLPGRLALEAVAAGTVLSTLTGSDVASVSMLGSVLTPEMEKRGYKKAMSLGPVMGSACLAIMIPPTTLGVFMAAVGEISIGKMLIAIIIPGLLMAILYAAYIITRCRLQPSLAPAYEVAPSTLSEKAISLVRYVLPLAFIVFLIIGVMFLGIATPSEAAATGALGTFILAAAYGRLNWEVAKKSILSTIQVTGMVLMIMVGAKAFSQILAYSGTTQGAVEVALGLPLSPILIIVAMMVVVVIMGMFISSYAIIMITLPLFMPIVRAMGFNDVWFGTTMLINIALSGISPPFAMVLFAMKAVAPPGTTMGHCYQAALPFCYIDLLAIALVIAFPAIALWLPGMMH